jgi:hypothetical protein
MIGYITHKTNNGKYGRIPFRCFSSNISKKARRYFNENSRNKEFGNRPCAYEATGLYNRSSLSKVK